jgi:sterol desaturase/sphingolipid hydroxylase (fatty acid hydroxylase superfamily)
MNESATPSPASAQHAASWRVALGGYLPPAAVAVLVVVWSLGHDRLPLPGLFYGSALAILVVVQVLELFFERHRRWRTNARELATDGFYTLVTFAIATFLIPFADMRIYQLGESLGLPALWPSSLPLPVKAGLCLVIFELGQYWLHRAQHRFALLWRVHGPHHHLRQLNAWKGSVGNPIELWLINVSLVTLFGAGIEEVLLQSLVVLTVTSFAHGNIAGDSPAWYRFFFTTVRAHSVHHSVRLEDTQHNFANTLIIWDRVFGTFQDGDVVDGAVGQGQLVRLSIPQQLLFPFRSPGSVEAPLGSASGRVSAGG